MSFFLIKLGKTVAMLGNKDSGLVGGAVGKPQNHSEGPHEVLKELGRTFREKIIFCTLYFFHFLCLFFS